MTVRSPRALSIYVLKRSIFVLTASGSARREFTVSARRFSFRRNGVRPPEV